MSILVKKGADVNVRDTLGRTPLHYASELGQDDNLEMLLNHGADPNVMDTETKKSPLLLAIENGQKTDDVSLKQALRAAKREMTNAKDFVKQEH